MVTIQSPVPGQVARDQPEKVGPASASAERTTEPLYVKLNLQIAPQSVPSGELLTVPVPFFTDAFLTVRVCGPTKVAFTVFALSTATIQSPVPGHSARDQPVKTESAVELAERATGVPSA
jgi:hypothetical protein